MSFTTKGLVEMERSYRTAAKRLAAGEARAVRRTGVTISARQARAIAGIVNLRIGTIKKKIVTVRQPTADAPRVVFEVEGEGISLREYGARQTRAGVSVLILRGAGRKIIPGAFMARGYGNNLQVFRRTGLAKRLMQAGRYKGTGILREPIEKLWGPDVYSQYVKDAIQRVGTETWNERLAVELDRETDFALKYAGLI